MESSSSFLFHHSKFVFRDLENSIVTFENDRTKIYFSRKGESLISLDRAPFGNFIVSAGNNVEDVTLLIEKIQDRAAVSGITEIIIKSFPESYQPQQSDLINKALLRSGFAIQHDDISQVVPILTKPMNLNTHKRRRIRKAEASGFRFSELTPDFLEASYALIVASRSNKGYPVTMSYQELYDMFTTFPNEYLLFGVFDSDKLISTSISIKVNTDILYCFYIGDDLAYRPYSPVTYLINGIYHYCSANNFKLLDLGMSTDKGILNKGLYTFKKTFGTFDSHKLTFVKKL